MGAGEWWLEMEPLDRAIPKKELATGIGTSLLIHVLIFGGALFAALLIPHKPLPIPYSSVELVTLKNIGAGMVAPKGELSGARKAVKRAHIRTRAPRQSGPVVPIRRLTVRDTTENIQPSITQIVPKNTAAAPVIPQGVESIDKNLDKLISKPEGVSRRRRQVRIVERRPVSRARSSKVAATEAEAAAPRGRPSGKERGGHQGIGAGSAVGSPNGNAAVAQVLGIYGLMVKERIQKEWSLTNDQGVSGLRTVIELQIAKTGQIVRVLVMRRSGNVLFDEAAVRAVNMAGPLPPVPVAARGSVPEFILTFMPGKVS